MRAFWWFKEKSIAGMARPGFNLVHWMDLPFDEAVLLGWIGRYSSGQVPRKSFHAHVADYAPRIFKFHKLDDSSGPKAIESLSTDAGLKEAFSRLSSRSKILADFRVDPNHIHFEISEERLSSEIQFLKEQGIRTLVSLTEEHHHKEELQNHFSIHHIGIADLEAPNLAQAAELADIIKTMQKSGTGMAVHCLAGIGRTSTMLMAAQILLGESAAEAEKLLAKQNPAFALTGTQFEFIRSISNR